jgi:hypothetical protein
MLGQLHSYRCTLPWFPADGNARQSCSILPNSRTSCGKITLTSKHLLPCAVSPARHLVAQGWDYHHESGQHFEVSIPLAKVVDPAGGVLLAWGMNGAELLPDHGYPVRRGGGRVAGEGRVVMCWFVVPAGPEMTKDLLGEACCRNHC